VIPRTHPAGWRKRTLRALVLQEEWQGGLHQHGEFKQQKLGFVWTVDHGKVNYMGFKQLII